MRPEDAGLPRSGHVFGNLSPEEEQALYRAAAEDQELYNELMEQQMLREALASPQARNELLAELDRLSQPAWRRAVAWLLRPAGLALAGAAAVVVGVVLWRTSWVNSPMDVANQPSMVTDGTSPATVDLGEQSAVATALAEASFALSGSGPITGVLALSGTRLQIGDGVRLQIQVNQECRATLIEKRPDGSYLRLFPNQFHSSSRLQSGESVLIPPSGQGSLLVQAPAGRRMVRLLLFPPDVDPLELTSLDRRELADRITVIEKAYEVN